MRCYRVGVCLAVWGLTACSSSSGDGSRRSVGSLGRGEMPAAGSGDADAPGPSDFGNSDGPAGPPAGVDPAAPTADKECPPGERCFDDNPDTADCGTVRLETEVEVLRQPGNVLLVFDRSGSMGDNWEGQARWQTAGDAITNALTPLADDITVGSVFFPSPVAAADPNTIPACMMDPMGLDCLLQSALALGTGTCGVNPIDQPDQIAFAPGAMFLQTLSSSNPPLYAPVLGGLTPLMEGLQQAQTAIALSMLTGTTAVVIITDGAPNCGWNDQTAYQIVTDWQAMGINTHVIGLPGLPGVGGPGAGPPPGIGGLPGVDAETVLNQLAAAGGTTGFITPADASALETKLREIAQETVRSGFNSCEVALDPPAEVPEKLRMIVLTNGQEREVARKLSDDAGWSITDDGAMVTIMGQLCEEAMTGVYEEIRFEFSCKEIPPLPVPAVK